MQKYYGISKTSSSFEDEKERTLGRFIGKLSSVVNFCMLRKPQNCGIGSAFLVAAPPTFVDKFQKFLCIAYCLSIIVSATTTAIPFDITTSKNSL